MVRTRSRVTTVLTTDAKAASWWLLATGVTPLVFSRPVASRSPRTTHSLGWREETPLEREYLWLS